MTKAEKEHLSRVAALGCIEVQVSGRVVIFDIESALLFVGIPLHVGSNGYVRTCRKGSAGFVHRIIVDAQDGELVDHINGNPLDNRSCNLRICSDAENNMNKRLRSNNSTGVSGIWWDKNRMKWSVQISAHGKRRCVGRFDDLFSAAAARRRAELEMHGDFAASLGVLA